MNYEEETALRERLTKEMCENTARYRRAYRFAGAVLHLMRDFVPSDRECQRHILDQVMLAGFAANAEMINVPPECDHLDKLALERRMLEASMTDAGISVELPTSRSPAAALSDP